MSHPLDCDGVAPHLFHYLAKENRRMESARVFIPSTVIFENGFASAWYYSAENMEVKKKNNKNIPMEEVYNHFAGTIVTDDPIYNDTVVAEFVEFAKVNQAPSAEGQPPRIVSGYFTRTALKEFLFSSGQKPRGLLQRFEPPKGRSNAVILAAWSPKLTITEGLRSVQAINDHTKTACERCATYESRDAVPVVLTNSITAAVRQACQLVVQHLKDVEPIRVSGLMLKLKITRSNKVLVLYSTCIRASPVNSLYDASELRPLNLRATFHSRDDDEQRKALAEHLRLFGGQKEEALREKKVQQEEQKRRVRAMSKTPQPTSGGTGQHRLPPLLEATASSDLAAPSSPSVASSYAQRSKALLSEIASPEVYPNAIKIGGGKNGSVSRWMPLNGRKLVPIRYETAQEREQRMLQQKEKEEAAARREEEAMNQHQCPDAQGDDDDDLPNASVRQSMAMEENTSQGCSVKQSMEKTSFSLGGDSPQNESWSPTDSSKQPKRPHPLGTVPEPVADAVVDLVYGIESDLFGPGGITGFDRFITLRGEDFAVDHRESILSALRSFEPNVVESIPKWEEPHVLPPLSSEESKRKRQWKERNQKNQKAAEASGERFVPDEEDFEDETLSTPKLHVVLSIKRRDLAAIQLSDVNVRVKRLSGE